MKKKLMKIFICFSLALCLTGCGEQKQDENKKNKVESNNSQGEKINLNDNIYYYTDVELTKKDCGGFGFPKNAEDVLDASWFSSYDNLKYVDKMELLMHDNILYDEEKEVSAKKEWDKLKQPSRGIAEFSSGYDEHEFYFGYWYINLVKDEEGTEFGEKDKYYDLEQKLKQERDSFKEKAYSIIKDRGGYRLNGTCGGPSYEMLLLDSKACDKYNLNCDRW